MKHTYFLTQVGLGGGLTSVALGLLRALERKGVRVAFFKPVGIPDSSSTVLSDVATRLSSPKSLAKADFSRAEASAKVEGGCDRSVQFVRATTPLHPPDAIPLERATRALAEGRLDELMGEILENFEQATTEADVVVAEGLPPSPGDPYLGRLSREIATALNAQIIIVAAEAGRSTVELDDQLEYAAENFGGLAKIQSVILNRVASQPEVSMTRFQDSSRLLKRNALKLLGAVPENPDLTYCRTIDVQRQLKAQIVHAGEINQRRVKSTSLLARTVPNLLHTLQPGALLMTPADRIDVIMAVALAALGRVPLAGLILTGETELDERIIRFCEPALETGLPLMRILTNSYDTGTAVYRLSPEVPPDDLERIELVMRHVAQHLDVDWLIAQTKKDLERRLSPAAFLFQLTEKARQANKRIVLPEGAEPRTIQAAAICARRKIARCVLLAVPADVYKAARQVDVELPSEVEILDPASCRALYVEPLFEARKHKGLSRAMAASQLEDHVVLGTMMLALGEVDGLVSGAVHSTANTIRPALQIIKTKPQAKVVSSIFFMCLPEQVLVYGDCAVIPNPDEVTLADIAIQSADSAAAFGITPRVAMISYSTGESGSGADVDKVRAATKLAQQLRPGLLIDGPLQYDAASIPDVARTKAPDSPVAGRATVFIFPDLNTGNTTYKAVQRSAKVISVGPMLQGLRRPVNDLSRGALVDDIVYTIALTAIQATQE